MKSWRTKALLTTVTAACAIPVAAQDFSFQLEEAKARDEEAWSELTEVKSSVEVGVGYVSEDSFKHGEYNGLESQGLYPVLNFDIRAREAYDSESGKYWRARGTNLGLDARNLDLEFGDQGDYRLRLEYDQLPRMQFGSTETIFEGAGGTSLQLPADGSQADLASSLRKFNVKQERRRIGIEAEKFLLPRWSVRASFKHETKEGSKITGIPQNPGFFSPSVLLPEPIDYETNQFRASVAYTGDKGQAELGYQLSLFENQNRFFTWQDPYANDWSTAPERQFSQAPDNEFHQVRLTGGYNLTPQTRSYADVSVGRMIQDQRLLDPGLLAPRTTADAQIDTRVVNLGINSRALPNLNLTANYRFDDRDNSTRQVEINGILNNPYSYREHRIKLAADYRIQPRSNLSVSYVRKNIDRTLVAREDLDDGIIEARLRTMLNPMVSGGVLLAREVRRGSTYVGADSNPALRQAWLADRDRDRYGIFVNASPLESLALGASVNRIRDRYDASELGLTDGEATVYNLDGSFIPYEGLTTYGFYNYEDNESRQAGPSWTAQLIDRVGTAGLGLSKSLLDDRLNIGTDLLYAKGVGRARVTSDLSGQQPLPPLVTRLRQVNLYGDYQLRKDLALGVRYRVERYESTDWAIDGIAPDTAGGLITMGGNSPYYKVHVIMATVDYRF